MSDSKVLLRKFDEHATLCSFEPGNEAEILKAEKGCGADGSFSYLGGELLGLYKRDEALFLAVGKKEYPIQNLHLHHDKDGLNRQLKVVCDGVEIKKYEYKSTFSVKNLLLDIVSFNDFGNSDEDFDFGLFVFNIIHNKERQKIMLNHEVDL